MACEHNLSFLESEDLQKAITQWQEWDTNSKDKEELDGLVEAKDMRTLRAYFTQRCVRKRRFDRRVGKDLCHDWMEISTLLILSPLYLDLSFFVYILNVQD